MPNTIEPIPENAQIVEQPVIKKGTIEIGTINAFQNPAPRWVIVSMNTIISMNSSAAVFLASIDGISMHQIKTIMIILGGFSLLCQSLKKAIGVVDKNS